MVSPPPPSSSLCRSPSRRLLSGSSLSTNSGSFSTSSYSPPTPHQPSPLPSQFPSMSAQGTSAQSFSMAGGSFRTGGSMSLASTSPRSARHAQVSSATQPSTGAPHVAKGDPVPSPFSLNPRNP